MREVVYKIVKPADICWIDFSHFEIDESRSLDERLGLATSARSFCSIDGAKVSIYEYASRRVKVLRKCNSFGTGKHVFRFISKPYLPHCRDAGLRLPALFFARICFTTMVIGILFCILTQWEEIVPTSLKLGRVL